MMAKTMDRARIWKLVLLALFTAIVFVLQLAGTAIRIGQFTFNFTLLPIVIGAALIGPLAGCWLGLVFGVAVLASGDAAPFMQFSVPAAVAVVLLKGALSGFAAGGVYKLLENKSKTAATLLAAAVCPIVNTGIFILGAYAFFLPLLKEWWGGVEYASVTAYIFLAIVGANFLIEFALNIVLCPIAVRLIQIGQNRSAKGV